MYCVRCGVKLQDGVRKCPLCDTPVLIDPDSREPDPRSYSDRYPKEESHVHFLLLGIVTALMIAVSLICLIICLRTFGRAAWSGYVMLGMALVWIICILPNWFPKWMPMIFIPIDIGALCGYLLYFCLKNGSHWFLTFAFPVTLLFGAFLIGTLALLLYVKKGRLFIIGGLLIAIGCSCMLIELFEHITFGTTMFEWSLYCVTFFSVCGIFLILAGIIKPLRSYLERKFFF